MKTNTKTSCFNFKVTTFKLHLAIKTNFLFFVGIYFKDNYYFNVVKLLERGQQTQCETPYNLIGVFIMYILVGWYNIMYTYIVINIFSYLVHQIFIQIRTTN